MHKKNIEVVLDVATGEHKLFKHTRIVNFHNGEGQYLKVTLNSDGSIHFWSGSKFHIEYEGKWSYTVRLGGEK
jgi:hypothetical protein